MTPKTKKTMLLAVPFAMSLGVAAAAEASPDPEKTAYCRVGNGKSVSYLDTLHACQKARAEGRKVTFIKAEPKKDAAK